MKIKKYKKENIKISTAVNFISIVAISALIVLSFIGQQKITLLNSNIDDMYNKDVNRVILSRTIATNLTSVQTNVKNQIIEYDPALKATIETDISDLKGSVQSYMEMEISSDEKTGAENLLSTVEKYSTAWNEDDVKLAGGQKLDEQSIAILRVYEKSSNDYFNKLTVNNKISAEKKYFLSNTAAKKALRQFLVISIVAVVFLVISSVFIFLSIKRSIKNMTDTMDIIAGGNLNVKIDTDLSNEFGIMNKSLDKTAKSVSLMIKDVMGEIDEIIDESKVLDGVASQMFTASKDVVNATQVMAEGSISQAEDLMNIDKQFSEFSDKLNTMISAVSEIKDSNSDIHKLTKEGESDINVLLSSSEKVSNSFEGFKDQFSKFTDLISKVNNIIEVITQITSQTRLLSLNASIEAARAGEYGKGFAVVAGEVNKLSEESRESANEITKLINTISTVTDEILSVTEEMGQELTNQQANTDGITRSLQNIIKNINMSASKIDLLSESANTIKDDRDKLVDRVLNASSIAEEISASAEEISASAGKMDDYASKVVHSAHNLDQIVKETDNELHKFEV